MNDDLTSLTADDEYPQVTGIAVTGIPAMRRAVLMRVFEAMDDGDVDGMVAHMTDDVVTRLGNEDEVRGTAAFRALFGHVGQAVKGLRHEVFGLWHAVEDFDVWVAQLRVTYTRLDDSTVTLPCCNMFRMRGELVAEYRVYVDINPVLAGRQESDG